MNVIIIMIWYANDSMLLTVKLFVLLIMQSVFVSVPSVYVFSYLYISVNISDDFVKLW